MSEMCYRCMQPAMQGGRCSACGHVPAVRSAADMQSVLKPGSTLDGGSIIVGESLGSGGFGITYIAKDAKFGLVALKEFYPRHMVSRQGKQVVPDPMRQPVFDRCLRDFRREVKHLLNLRDHPNIVNVLFDLEENGTFYYGMELLKGETLKAYVQRQPTLTPQKAFALLEPVIDALAYAHRQKTLHRDIAPDNIFLRSNPADPDHPSPCLIDFGAAYTAKDDFTQTSPHVRKNGFSPYEQLGSMRQQGPHTDVYALTATLYYLLTKQPPVPCDQRVERLTPLVPASQLNPHVSAGLDHVIDTGMALDYTQRYLTMEDLRDALRSVLQPKKPSSPPPPPSAKFSLVCTRGPMAGQSFPVTGEMVIGREGMLRIVAEDRRASRRHCRLFNMGGTWYISDLNSHNGTVVNGARLTPGAAAVLHQGDVVIIGAEEFRIQSTP